MHTLQRFWEYADQIHLILVLPANDFALWDELCRQYAFDLPIQKVTGGTTRFQSVKNGLDTIVGKEGVVAVHDGVRPFVTVETIRQSFEVAQQKGCAVTAIALKDSIREVIDEGKTIALDRTHFRLIQTPQTFQVSILKDSFQLPESPQFTDDASVVEKAGFSITLIEGSYQNIKITTPDDLIWAEAFLLKSE